MANFFKGHRAFVILVILIIGIAFYLLFYHKSQPEQINNTRFAPTQSISNPEITPILSPTLTPSSQVAQTAVPTSANPGGPPQGRIICNYEIPVGPNTYGTADLSSTWSNLSIGKNGSAQAAICVVVNGGSPTLMSLDNSINGSRDTTVPWLAPNTDYTFNLYDDHGGDNANCTGTVLNSCQIPTMLPATPTP